MSEFRQYTCLHCSTLFTGRVRDRKKGLALFCSKSCAASGNKNHKLLYEKTCRNCAKEFTTSFITTKYCSDACKTKYRNRIRKTDRRRGIFKIIAALPCEICGYSRASRDVHHIIPLSLGGNNTKDNLISLCPNCHRECHENHFMPDYLVALIGNRDSAIFSS